MKLDDLMLLIDHLPRGEEIRRYFENNFSEEEWGYELYERSDGGFLVIVTAGPLLGFVGVEWRQNVSTWHVVSFIMEM